MGAQAFLEGVTLDTTLLDKLTAEMLPRASKVVQKYGIAMAADAAMNAPVDTGTLRGSIVSESHMIGPLLYELQDGVEYGAYVEFGTSRQAAQPFMIPAIEGKKDEFIQAFTDILK